MRLAAAFWGVGLLAVFSAADDATLFPVRHVQEPPETRLIQELPFDPERDHVVLEGRAWGKPVRLVLDTGASLCALSPIHRGRLGVPLARIPATSFSGRSLGVQVFKAPAIRVGKLKACPGGRLVMLENPAPVCARSFEMLADGQLGLEDLGRFVVQIDYDAGTVRFFRPGSRSEDWGASLPMEFPEGPHMTVLGRLPGGIDEEFVLDTGGGNALAPGLFSRVEPAARGETRFGVSCDITGLSEVPWTVVQGISVGGISYPPMRFDSDHVGGRSVLGRQFFRRNLVTFDFPNRRLYLKPGRRFLEPDRSNLLGAYFERGSSTRTVVASVAEGMPAAAAGIREGDELAEVDGKPASSWKTDDLWDFFASTTVARAALTLRRGDGEMEVFVTLDPPRPRTAEIQASSPATGKHADSGPGPWLLAETNVSGLHRLTSAEVLGVLGARPGQAYDAASLEAGLRRLDEHPAVAKASADVEPIAGSGARRGRAALLKVSVDERALVRSVGYSPVMERMQRDVLAGISRVSTGAYLSLSGLADGVRDFEWLFRTVGRPEAQIRARVDLDTATHAADVRYLYAGGLRQTVTGVALQGNRAFTRGRLLKAMEVGPGSVYSERLLQDALAGLRDFYRDQGFWDVELGTASVTFSGDGAGAALGIDIVEGRTTSIDQIVLGGVSDPGRRGEALERVRVRSGDILIRSTMVASLDLLRALPWVAGVAVEMQASDRGEGWVNVFFEVAERRPP